VDGIAQPAFMADGQAFVAGVFGAAYELRIHNRSGRRVEAVVAVDGRDVITGQPIDPHRHRGHLVPAWGTATIPGFRSSTSSVATFRFTTIPRSYAFRTGTLWGIGTVRAFVFDEDAPDPVIVIPPALGSTPDSAPVPHARSGVVAPDGAPSAPRDMGTEYGEQRWSPVMRTRFVRQSNQPSAVLGIRYQSRDALIAAGILQPFWHPVVFHAPPPPVHYCIGCAWPETYAPPPPGYPY
jgi:hypothetical protein